MAAVMAQATGGASKLGDIAKKAMNGKPAEAVKTADAKVKPKKKTKLKQAEEIIGYSERHNAAIVAQEKVVSRIWDQLEVSRKETARLRKSYDDAGIELRRIIRKGPERLPLFDGPAPEGKEGVPAAAAPTNNVPGPDAWRSVKLADTGLPAKVVEKLHDHKVTLSTMGELVDWQNKGGDIVHVKGIGLETATKASDILADWWKKHPEYKPMAKPEMPAKSAESKK